VVVFKHPFSLVAYFTLSSSGPFWAPWTLCSCASLDGVEGWRCRICWHFNLCFCWIVMVPPNNPSYATGLQAYAGHRYQFPSDLNRSIVRVVAMNSGQRSTLRLSARGEDNEEINDIACEHDGDLIDVPCSSLLCASHKMIIGWIHPKHPF
jgi:hypothetical protein